MTSKERAELRTRAMKMESIFQVGKSSLTPQLVDAIRAALKARELIKVNRSFLKTIFPFTSSTHK